MRNKKQTKSPKFISKILLMAYGFVPFLTPNFETLDSNGPKFLAFAILNSVVFLILLNTKEIRNDKNYFFGFFTNKIGIAYSLLIFFSLLSFTKAINISESILHFAKIFTTFSAAWFISIIIRYDKNAIKPLAVAMSGLLLIDNYQTFEGIFLYSKGKLPNIDSIKSSYSNKNILSSAIFIKIPFALWLFLFHHKWKKYIGGIALFTSVLSILFLSSRAFYLAILITSILLVAYSVLKFKKEREKRYLYNIGIYFSFSVLSLALFYLVKNNFYPEKSKGYNKDIISRLKSISNFEEESIQYRLSAWDRSFKLIKQEPLLGVGLGNWKIRVLKYENPENEGYKYMYKTHNDFVEITTESGIFAGMAFMSIFLFILWYFAVVLLKTPNKIAQKILFLPTFGIIIYSFDAFFNFPQDRPEIQSFFSVYVGMAVGIAPLFFKEKNRFKSIKKIFQPILIVVTGVLFIANIYVLYMNVKSLKIQRIVKSELQKGGTLKHSSAPFNDFPPIPNLNVLAEPIAVQKARYLFEKGKYTEAQKLLKKDNSSPYDARKEFFLATSYYNQKKYDSALHYAKISYKLKPLFFKNIILLDLIYKEKDEFDKSEILWKKYLQKNKKKKKKKKKVKVWKLLTLSLEKQGKYKEAKAVVDSICVYRPKNKKFKVKQNALTLRVEKKEYFPIYNKATNLYVQKKYTEAIPYFNNFINKVPYGKAYELRAMCYFRTKKYKEALNDIATLKTINRRLSSNILNIKGSCYLMLGDKSKALKAFKKSMDLGNKNGKINYLKFK